jgi:hypothetical protein
VAAQRGDVLDRLDQVGLALPVRPDENGRARLQGKVNAAVAAVIGEREMPYVQR